MPDRIWDVNPDLAAAAEAQRELYQGSVSLEDFYAYMPMHNYIYVPTHALWPAASVNARIRPITLMDDQGDPMLNDQGKEVILPASAYLDRYRPVEQMTWAPGLPKVINDRLILEGGWVERGGASCFNLYHPPMIAAGDPARAGKWVEHIR